MKRTHRIPVAILCLAAAVVAGFLLGRLGVPSASARPGDSARPQAESAPPAAQVWTCSMHPQIRLDGPGTCPICEMPLIVAASMHTVDGEAPALALSPHALAMARVATAPVTRRELTHELRAVGTVRVNETEVATVTSRVDGYAERLFVNVTGVTIKAGDHLAEIYSPELVVAQQELLIALQSSGGDAGSPLVQSARQKLLRWGLVAAQIDELVEQRTIADRVTLYAPAAGTVLETSIVQNSAFRAGDVLYRVVNLDSVWVYLDIYEHDLAWVRYGQRVHLQAEALPGREFEGRVSFIEPVVREDTRTIRVPVHVANADHALKPGMFMSATLQATLAADGRAAPTGVEGRYSCPMHPQVLADEPGFCPHCEMALEEIPGGAAASEDADDGGTDGTAGAPRFACPMECEGDLTYPEPGSCPVCNMRLVAVGAPVAEHAAGLLAVPVSAVLDSGTRKLVYVERAPGLFEPREIVTGPRAGEHFPVLSGLLEGERVAVRGGFLIDSQFQIAGQPSLFYPGGLAGELPGDRPDDSPAATPESRTAPAPHKH